MNKGPGTGRRAALHTELFTVTEAEREVADLLVTAIYDGDKNYIGPMVTWELVTEKLASERKVQEAAERERRQAEELRAKVESILGVIQGSDPKWVGSNLDFGNPPVGHKPEVFEKLVPYAYHTHAKLADFKDDGEATNSDYGKLLGILKAAKYAGAVSIEWEGKGEAVQGIKRTRDLILLHWPELPN